MSSSTAFATALLQHIFQNAAVANYGDATGLPAAATVGSLYLALHTADPGKTGNQSTNEAAYTGYARVAVARNSSNWSVSGTPIPQASNVNTIQFGQCTAGTSTVGWFSVGPQVSGATQITYSGQFSTVLLDGTADTAGNVTVPGHTLVAGDTIVFSTDNGETLPTGITAGTIYFVKVVTGNAFTFSATNGGTAIVTSTAGVVTVGKITTLVITTSSNAIPQISAGGIVLTVD